MSHVQTSRVTVVAFYKFVHLGDYREMRAPLRAYCEERGVRGSILLAEEGINATIAGDDGAIEDVLAYLRADVRLADLSHKVSYCDEQPFGRMKVRLKREIVTLGVEGIDPNSEVGQYVAPEGWNALVRAPDVVVVDTRNDYEVRVGTFKGALNPNIGAFGDFPRYVEAHLNPEKHPRVAMFCTGGIRCEKATAYLLQQGFKEVYHLQGGILKYLEDVPEAESLWEGECFVFDERVTLNHALEPSHAPLCKTCHTPILGGVCGCESPD